MKKSIVNIFLILTIISCTKDNTTFESLLTVDTLYTPAQNAFPEPYRNQQPFINIYSDTICGYYSNGSVNSSIVFYSFDGLKTTFQNEIPYGWQIVYFENKNIVIHRKNGTSSSWAGFSTMTSNDYGKTFTAQITKSWVFQERTYAPAFLNHDYGIFFTRPNATNGNISSIDAYKITGNSYAKISNVLLNSSGYIYPKLFSFIDDQNIFFIAYEVNNNGSFLVQSNDGGYTWSTQPTGTLPPIDNYLNNEFPHYDYLEIISPTKHVFYDTHLNWNGEEWLKYLDLYYSYDSGRNWALKELNLPGYINSIQFVDENTGFLLVKNSIDTPSKKGTIYKSTDAGETWVKLIPEVYANEIYFENETNGIASFKNIIQITKDGGQSWELLTY